jgi:patatin-like phospholipase/acyl hydrolase
MSSGNRKLRLLSLDGGGARGLSSIIILQRLMEIIDPENPPRPCDYFDMIGGTSTGGLIAIMLGRLRMTTQECRIAYEEIMPSVFTKRQHRSTLTGQLQGRFDSDALEKAIRTLLRNNGIMEEELLKSTESTCKT